MHLIYLHGFRSSPASFKARHMAAWMQAHRPDVHWWCPQLPASPAAAWALISQGTADWPTADMAVIGSSLGGYYATALAEARGCRAVLLNPAVDPARDLAAPHWPADRVPQPGRAVLLPGPNSSTSCAPWPCPPSPNPHGTRPSSPQGDEVLSWREMLARYDTPARCQHPPLARQRPCAVGLRRPPALRPSTPRLLRLKTCD